MKKILIIDGQGGKIGALLTARLKAEGREVYAVGTNGSATSAMLKAGADYGATGENPVTVNCRDADIIAGPIGIIIADSLMGEVTPAMAMAVGQSHAVKILLPINKCNTFIAGLSDISIPELIDAAVKKML